MMDSETKDAIHNLELAVRSLADETDKVECDIARRLEELEKQDRVNKAWPINLVARLEELERRFSDKEPKIVLCAENHDTKPQNSSDACYKHERCCVNKGKLAGLKLALEIVMPIEAAWNVSRITNEIQEEIAQLQEEIAQLEKELK